ncbi:MULTISPECIES: glutarate dioxygenase GlaH [Pandoraea]|uniref:glutarate dioxygenase GlaH n=1 Tax=Pandoraea TaxID=93217 RepID=UPI0003C76FF8|nr:MULTISPECIES: glutarate dioxygenase GlaH [Pandoraea]AHB74752.1 protein CsiD [Pandoraea pnomenusa]AHN76876.1 protein CsiD [Pandoraea pnomenusa]
MNSVTALPTIPSVDSQLKFSIERHPHHKRLRHITVRPDALQKFFASVKDVDLQNLEYVPFMRFMLAQALERAVGADFAPTLRKLVQDRATGGFTLGVLNATADHSDFVRFGTAVGFLLGPANHDAMSGTYYARFLVKDTDNSDSYLRQAYRLFTLHTDGTFVDEPTEWLLMMKFAEENAVGGESRFMHLDDWSERDTFLNDPLATRPFLYKAPGSKNVNAQIERPVFFQSEYGLSMSFIDQFVQPRSGAEATYLHDLSASMEAAAATREVPLPVGDLVVLNNYFWLHGRAPFQKHPSLHRELMRQRGVFSK